RIGQVENMSVEGLFVHGGDLWRLNTPLSCLQPPQQGKTHISSVNKRKVQLKIDCNGNVQEGIRYILDDYDCGEIIYTKSFELHQGGKRTSSQERI
ncbi:hypothetical protein SM147_00005, partial [Salmonella enterica]|uniref:hypothetical protein n=1 Tax=Salmonella enterica TaxID=28901 RepID=UPI002DB5F5EA